MSVNTELYKIFWHVAKCKSFTQASKELFISQPAISASIRRLEGQLGGTFFYRTRTGVELTPEGQAIFVYVERAMNLLDEADKSLERIKNLEAGSIRIGVSDNICKNYLASYINEFHNKYPEINIEIKNGATARTVALLKGGSVDIGFVNYPIDDDELEITPFVYLHDCFVVGQSLWELSKKKIAAKDIPVLPLVLLEKGTNTRRLFDESMHKLSIECSPKIEVGSHDMLVVLAKLGAGVSCVTEEYVQRELETRELIKLDVDVSLGSRQLGYCHIAKSPMNYANEMFCRGLKNILV